jgi:thiol:disulfide interchange protein
LLKHYVVAELYTDRENPQDKENNDLLNASYGAALPLYVIFTPEGKEIDRIGGRPSQAAFLDFLRKGLPAK